MAMDEEYSKSASDIGLEIAIPPSLEGRVKRSQMESFGGRRLTSEEGNKFQTDYVLEWFSKWPILGIVRNKKNHLHERPCTLYKSRISCM